MEQPKKPIEPLKEQPEESKGKPIEYPRQECRLSYGPGKKKQQQPSENKDTSTSTEE
jgi:hypothetical protein